MNFKSLCYDRLKSILGQIAVGETDYQEVAKPRRTHRCGLPWPIFARVASKCRRSNNEGWAI